MAVQPSLHTILPTGCNCDSGLNNISLRVTNQTTVVENTTVVFPHSQFLNGLIMEFQSITKIEDFNYINYINIK